MQEIYSLCIKLAKKGWYMNTILKNAVSSIQMGIEDFEKSENNGSSDRVISAVRNIYAGILLLFKEQLIRLSPPHDKELLIKSKNKYIKDKFGKVIVTSCGNKTVNFLDIKERFESLNIDVNWDVMEKIQKIRNDLEHYFTSSTKENILQIINNTFIILDNFIVKHLEEHPGDLLGNSTWEYIINKKEIYEKLKNEWEKISKSLNFSNRIIAEKIEDVYCPNCGFDIFFVDDIEKEQENPKLICKACGNEFEYEKYKYTIIEHFSSEYNKDYEKDLYDCCDCGEKTYLYEENICLSCDAEENNYCECGEKIEKIVMDGNIDKQCSNCIDYDRALEKDD